MNVPSYLEFLSFLLAGIGIFFVGRSGINWLKLSKFRTTLVKSETFDQTHDAESREEKEGVVAGMDLQKWRMLENLRQEERAKMQVDYFLGIVLLFSAFFLFTSATTYSKAVLDRSPYDSLFANRISIKISDTIEIDKRDSVVFKISKVPQKRYGFANPTVEVTLIDPEADIFKIVPLSTPRQVVSDKRVTRWAWGVMPKKSGRYELILRPSMVDQIGNHVDLKTWNHPVYVKASKWRHFSDFVDKHWVKATYFLGFLFWPYIPGFFRWIGRKFTRKKDRMPPGYRRG
jgi:hypothetical protein